MSASGLELKPILAEQNDEWAVCRRYMTLETLARISHPQDARRAAHNRSAMSRRPQPAKTGLKPPILHHPKGHDTNRGDRHATFQLQGLELPPTAMFATLPATQVIIRGASV
jgi:hypothetical protein